MATYRFQTPNRIEVPLDARHPLFRRIRNRQGICLVQHPDETWEEFEALPSIYDANADYLFGRTDRSSVPAGRGVAVSAGETPNTREFRSPLRIYRGGHVYHINDTLKTELEAAETTQESSGYGDYVSDALVVPTGTPIGDEILVSGRTAEYEQSVLP